MTLRTWVAATWFAAAALPARGAEPAQRADSVGVPDTAIVLAIAPDEAAAKAWVKRWRKVSSLFSDLINARHGYPEITLAEDLRVPGATPGALAVVLGYCSAKEAAPRLDLLRSIYPGSAVVKASPRSKACPQLHPGARLVEARAVEVDGWRLFVGQYLKDPMPADVPVGRKTPHDPGAGMVSIIPILFDPDGLMRQARGPFHYRCVTDELEWPNTCKVDLRKDGEAIVVDVQWGQRPHPCSGDMASLHVRSVFKHGGREIVSQEDVLEREDVPLCD